MVVICFRFNFESCFISHNKVYGKIVDRPLGLVQFNFSKITGFVFVVILIFNTRIGCRETKPINKE
jgi:hypothetical protein